VTPQATRHQRRRQRRQAQAARRTRRTQPQRAAAVRPVKGWSQRRLDGLMWSWRRGAMRLGTLAVMYRRQGFTGARLRRMVMASNRTGGRLQRSPQQLLHLWRQAARRVGRVAVLRKRRTDLADAAQGLLQRTRRAAARAAASAASTLATRDAQVEELRAALAAAEMQLSKALEDNKSLRARQLVDQRAEAQAMEVAKDVAETRTRQAEEAVVALRRANTRCGRLQEMNRQLVSTLMREQAARRKTHNELEEALGKVRVYCRIRPLLSTEVEAGFTSTLRHHGRTVEVNVKGRGHRAFKVCACGVLVWFGLVWFGLVCVLVWFGLVCVVVWFACWFGLVWFAWWFGLRGGLVWFGLRGGLIGSAPWV